MIIGLGIDLVGVDGFAEQLADKASTFEAASFTANERAYAREALSGQPATHLAARYAAKEAALKAFDLACAHASLTPPKIALQDIEIARDERGRPSLVLHASAATLAEQLGIDRALVSLSHDGGYAMAVVTLETLV